MKTAGGIFIAHSALNMPLFYLATDAFFRKLRLWREVATIKYFIQGGIREFFDNISKNNKGERRCLINPNR
jgi:hypothetical protein